jgi:hypothetical protein
MNFGMMLEDALAYTKEGIFNNRDRWMKLS